MVNIFESEGLSVESQFLKNFFSRLNEQGIDYCVLRNYESLPNSLGGSDLDILFSSKCFSEANVIITELAYKYGLKCIAAIQAYRVLTRIFLGAPRGLWWGVRFDAFSYAGTNGCDILPVEHVLKRAVIHNGIRVASLSDASIMSFLKDIIGSGMDRKQYQGDASLSFKLEKHIFVPILKRYFGNTCVHSTIIPLLENKLMDLRHAQNGIKRSWLFTNINKDFKNTVTSRFMDYCHRFQRLFRPLGISVAFLGTDGSGKTTIINMIRPILESALHTQTYREHLRPNLLPSIGQLFGRPALIDPVTNPHSSAPSGIIGSILRLVYYSLDYILGYWVKVYPILVKRPCVFIFDRYYYDLLYDPHRS